MLSKWTRGRDRDILDTNHPTTSGGHYHFLIGRDGTTITEITRNGKRKPFTPDFTDEFDYVWQRIIEWEFNEKLGKMYPREAPGYGGMVTFHFEEGYFEPTIYQ